MKHKITKTLLLAFLSTGMTQCVKSNLDNVFDPTNFPGLFIGIALATGANGNSGSSTDPTVSVCSEVTPTIVEFSTVGTTTYTVPAGTQYVTIRVIGGGGGGAVASNVGDCYAFAQPTNGGDSSVRIQGAGSDLVSATGGAAGTCGDNIGNIGLGGTGGTPGGIDGEDGTFTTVRAKGFAVAGLYGKAGDGGLAAPSSGGGAGGTGGLATDTLSDLSGETLEITVGEAGKWFVDGGPGTQGYVQLILF